MSEVDGQTKQRLKGWPSVDKDSQDEWVGENYSDIYLYHGFRVRASSCDLFLVSGS